MRLAIAVHAKWFPLNPAPSMEGLKHFGGGSQGFQELEWLPIDEFEPQHDFEGDAKGLGVHFVGEWMSLLMISTNRSKTPFGQNEQSTKQGEFIKDLKLRVPLLTRLPFTIRKRAVK